MQALMATHVRNSVTRQTVHAETLCDVKLTLSHFQHGSINQMHRCSTNVQLDSSLTNDFQQFFPFSSVGSSRSAYQMTRCNPNHRCAKTFSVKDLFRTITLNCLKLVALLPTTINQQDPSAYYLLSTGDKKITRGKNK